MISYISQETNRLSISVQKIQDSFRTMIDNLCKDNKSLSFIDNNRNYKKHRHSIEGQQFNKSPYAFGFSCVNTCSSKVHGAVCDGVVHSKGGNKSNWGQLVWSTSNKQSVEHHSSNLPTEQNRWKTTEYDNRELIGARSVIKPTLIDSRCTVITRNQSLRD